jgi:hypothetical protein
MITPTKKHTPRKMPPAPPLPRQGGERNETTQNARLDSSD